MRGAFTSNCHPLKLSMGTLDLHYLFHARLTTPPLHFMVKGFVNCTNFPFKGDLKPWV